MTIAFVKPLAQANFPAKTASYSGTAASTGTWDTGAPGVLVWTSTASHVVVGEGVTATTSSTPIPANTPIAFQVPVGTGGAWRVSAIQVSGGSSGVLYAKPMNE